MRIFSNLAISLDGKIADLACPDQSLGTPLDRKRMDQIRSFSDIVLLGAKTLRVHSDPLHFQKKPKRYPAIGFVTSSGLLPHDAYIWSRPEIMKFVFTSTLGLRTALQSTKDGAFVIDCGASVVSMERVLNRLKESQFKNILVEGGGELMHAFLKENFLQELYVTLTPWLIGGRQNPTLVGGIDSLKPWAKLKLLQSKKIKDELYLHYKVKGALRGV